MSPLVSAFMPRHVFYNQEQKQAGNGPYIKLVCAAVHHMPFGRGFQGFLELGIYRKTELVL